MYGNSAVSDEYVNGARQEGRPRKGWLDNICEDCEVLGLSLLAAERLVNDKLVWRSVVHILDCQRATTASSLSGH